jgi:two-component system, sensor histidine kinase PdtaS
MNTTDPDEKENQAQKLRQRAEDALQGKLVDLNGLPADDIQSLLHELQVHQAELSIQNEELRRVQLDLEISRDVFSDLYNFAPAGYCTLSQKGRIRNANQTLGELLGVDQGKLLHRLLSDFVDSADQDEYYLHCQRALKEHRREESEIRLVKQTGEQIIARMESAFARNDPTQLLVMLSDITEHKRAEDALRQALAEKDILMRELQHRVKNSLAIVVSLLSLEEMNLNNEQARAIFATTRSRIESISAVYGQLYHSGGVDQVNLRHYIHSLVEGLSRSYLSSAENVRIETQSADVQLDIQRAMPLGIILNELTTNALKYAFPAGYRSKDGLGMILVELSVSGGSIHLCVTDNGVGLPAGKQSPTGTGLGLVEMLTQQLNGKLTIDGTHGMMVHVIFDQA